MMDSMGRFVTLLCGIAIAAHAPTVLGQSDEPPASELVGEEIPPFFLEGLSIVQTGPATDHARFELRGTVRFTENSRPSERIPLLLPKCALLDSKFTGEGEHAVAVAKDRSGYEIWISGKQNSRHDFVLTFARKLLLLGQARRLELTLPSHTIPLELWLPETDPHIILDDDRTITDGAGPGERSGTWKVRLVSLGGAFRIQWQPKGTGAATQRADLTAVGEIEYRFVDARQVEATAKIEVSQPTPNGSTGFTLRLPTGFTLVEDDPDDFSMVVLDGRTSGRGQLIRVEPDEFSETMEVELRARLNRQYGTNVELAGFYLEGSTFQSNRITVRFPTQWTLQAPVTLNARRVDRDNGSEIDREGVAHFDVFHQANDGASLQVDLRERQTRVLVQPTYRLRCDESLVTLDARLRFDIRGNLPDQLEIWTGAWGIAAVDTAIAPNLELAGSEADVQVVPIDRPEVAAAAFFVDLRGEIPLSELPTALQQVTLPHANRDVPLQGQSIVMAPARLILTTASGLDVALQVNESAFSFNEPPDDWELLSGGSREGLRSVYFQFETNAIPTVTLNVRERPRAITGTMDATLQISPQRTNVEQTFALSIANQPLDAVAISLPSTATELRLTIDDREVSISDWPPTEVSSGRATRDVPLNSPRLGSMTMRVTYRLLGIRRSEDTASRQFSLVTLADTTAIESMESRLTLNDTLRRDINLSSGDWVYGFSPTAAAIQASSQGVVGEVTIDVAPSASSGRQPDVSKTWIRTILTDNRRVDHYASRLRAPGDIRLRLPAGTRVSINDLLIAVDGRRVANVRLVDTRDIEIPLGRADAGRSILLEVWYQFSEPVGDGRHNLSFAEVVDARGVGRMYWELISDPDRHLLLSPDNCFSENEWVRGALGWRRKPTMSAADVRGWLEMPAPDDDFGTANRYLFSSVGTMNRVQIYTCHRTWLVFFASLVALMLGVLVAYWQPARHPLAFSALGTVMVGLTATWPTTGVLVIQSAFVGLVLAAVCLLLRWWYLPVRPRLMGATEGVTAQAVGERSTHSIARSHSSGGTSPTTLVGSRS